MTAAPMVSPSRWHHHLHSPWFRYGNAAALTAFALVARVNFGGAFYGPTLIVFTIPITLSAYWGGAGPGLLATGISALGAAYYLLPPLHDFRVLSDMERVQEGTLLLAGGLISAICMLLHQARGRAEAVIESMERAQSALRDALKSTGDLRLALDEHAIVAVTNQKGLITFVNDKFCDISQYAREELLGQDHRIINSGFHSAEFIRTLWTTIARGKVWHGVIRNRTKHGAFYWVDTTIVPFLNDAGKPTQYIAIRADVTERKRVEDAMRDNETRFRTMANSIPQLAWIARADGSINWYNDRWYEYTGATREQMESLGWQSVHEPKSLPAVMSGWTSAIANGVLFEMEFPLRAANGQFRTFLTRVQPIRNADREVTHWFGTSTDVHELKRAEEKVLQLNASLEQRVLERTAEVEAANKELEAFSYSVSHDLRAPLRAMNGFAEMTLEEFGPSIPPEAARYLERIRSGGKQMGQLIDDLLAFSRLSRQPLKTNLVNMTVLIREVLAEVESWYEGRNVVINVGELPDCHGDITLLRQVWINLISNAIKYSRGQPTAVIDIGFTTDDGESNYWVRDNGAGFDMQYAHKLFEVFQRLHRADQFEGTGVGLAIVQRIVHRHGGRVWAQSAPGRGATFRFTLPQKA